MQRFFEEKELSDMIPKMTPRRRREKKPTGEICDWHNVARRAEQEKVELEIKSAVEKRLQTLVMTTGDIWESIYY